MANELRNLVKQERNSLKTFEAVECFLDNFDSSVHSVEVEIRLERLEAAFSEFHRVRRQIELITEDVEEDEESEMEKTLSETSQARLKQKEAENEKVVLDVENNYCRLKAALMSRLSKQPSTQPNLQQLTAQGTSTGLSRVKLPEIRLPTFGGHLKDWVTFRDTFRSLIHNNPQLTEMDKFTYLRSSLSGEALQEINSVEMSDVNYVVAWTMLEKRYENKKLIVKAHLDALFSIEPIRREGYELLSRLISDFDKHLLMLDKVGEDTNNWSTILVYMVCSRLDSTTLRNWETHHNSKEVPKYKDLMHFLRDQCSVLQSVAPAKAIVVPEKKAKFSVTNSVVQPAFKCPFCGEGFHSAFRCLKFLKLKVPERSEAVRRSRLCLNCLYPGHQARVCSRGACHHCQQKHHSLLHPEQQPPSEHRNRSSVPQGQPRPSAVNQQQPQTQLPNQHQPAQAHTTQQPTRTPSASHSQSTAQPSTSHQSSTNQNTVALPTNTQFSTQDILLSTALVCVQDSYGNSRLARALLDSCSQFCFMTTQFSSKLNLQSSAEHMSVQGIGGSVTVARKSVKATVLPRISDLSPFHEEMTFYVLPELTATLPARKINVVNWNFPSNITFADPQFHEPGRIDLIIGAEHYLDLLTDGREKIVDGGPTLQNTVFGWIVSGRAIDHSLSVQQTSAYSCTLANLQEQLSKFWELETCHTHCTQSVEETACEAYYDQTTVRDEGGRFVVTLPKRDYIVAQLGESEGIATRRFLGLERRFQQNPELKAAYAEFIREYEQLGHMVEVPVSASQGNEVSPVYYLPHHAVFKLDSTTTKLRVVFDASCKTSSGVSLNDALMVGPVIQEDLISITLRFRLFCVAIVADIEKMYRMILVQHGDRSLQRIVYRSSPDEPLRTYELTTVTYGTAAAPYLATKCLQRLADEEASKFPRAAKVLREDFYVDDMLTGANTVEEAKQLAEEMVELTASGGFNLRKWNSNSKELLAQLPQELLDSRALLELDSSSSPVKTLGLQWEPQSDSFRYDSPQWNNDVVPTKRIVLAEAARLFDPLGLIGPVVVIAKIFLQELWKHNCGWDDPLPEAMQQFWQEYRLNLTALSSFSIPRWIGYKAEAVSMELHGFCDASDKAYGACIYTRCTLMDSSVEVRLLIAKSRVAPLEDLKRNKKRLSTPRLELSSALLLCHLYEKVKASIRIPHNASFWTDSTIVVHWLSSLPSRWQIFVANRVSEIQHITKGFVWNHVAGAENPADVISRGMTPAQLLYHTIWLEGPAWLRRDRSTWPVASPEEDFDRTLLEERSAVAIPAQSKPNSELFGLHSSLFVLVRRVAWIRRFIHNCRRPEEVRSGNINHIEHQEAMLSLVRLAQNESFPEEISALQRGNQVKPSSPIHKLWPILVEGVLRVGGRLSEAPVSSTRKHPAILCYRHPLSKLIVVDYHLRLFHAGQQLLTSSVREKYWPTQIRRLANTIIHECVSCFRNKPKVLDQLMANLPSERVSPAPPFVKVGVDYCGPFFVANSNRRAAPRKYFLAVFVCLVTKAVHLELVGDLTSAAFIAAFKRFVARRGKPVLVMCDNALNFVGARRELSELHRLFRNQQFQESVAESAEEDEIEFRFIPARSPNFGGLWEAAVKSFKGHFKRTVGSKILPHDAMHTAIVQIEAILNSRPLTPVSSDPMDFEALTPGHFLIQRPLTAVPEPDLSHLPKNRLSLWQEMQDFVQHMWKVWSRQYLSDLNNRTKWTRRRNNISVGTMVVVREDNLPPLKWKLGRIVQVHAGTDGNIRVVTVKTQDGLFRRAISKICVLPIRDNQTDSTTEDH